jgi:hypothetical protein
MACTVPRVDALSAARKSHLNSANACLLTDHLLSCRACGAAPGMLFPTSRGCLSQAAERPSRCGTDDPKCRPHSEAIPSCVWRAPPRTSWDSVNHRGLCHHQTHTHTDLRATNKVWASQPPQKLDLHIWTATSSMHQTPCMLDVDDKSCRFVGWQSWPACVENGRAARCWKTRQTI